MTGMTSETKKKIRPGLIEADPRESQILVHYETDEIVDGKVSVFDTFPTHNETHSSSPTISKMLTLVHTDESQEVPSTLEHLICINSVVGVDASTMLLY
jgi:hypothetical protein